MKQLLPGNAAVARGLYKAGCALWFRVIRVRRAPKLRPMPQFYTNSTYMLTQSRLRRAQCIEIRFFSKNV